MLLLYQEAASALHRGGWVRDRKWLALRASMKPEGGEGVSHCVVTFCVTDRIPKPHFFCPDALSDGICHRSSLGLSLTVAGPALTPQSDVSPCLSCSSFHSTPLCNCISGVCYGACLPCALWAPCGRGQACPIPQQSARAWSRGLQDILRTEYMDEHAIPNPTALPSALQPHPAVWHLGTEHMKFYKSFRLSL